MKVTTPEISWHEREPIYSVDFQPGPSSVLRLASCGVDKIVRIWQMRYDSDGKGHFEFLSNLRRHTASVNVVRFSKNGEFLASAGDDCAILIWKLSDVSSPSNNIFAEEEVEEDKESWVCYKTLRGHLGDVQDLSWSKDSKYLVSGSVDNSAIVWDIKKAQKIAFFNDHKSYVQGVAFDPLGDFIATLSSDRSMRIYSLTSKNCVHNVSKMTPILTEESNSQTESKPKSFRIFHDDGLRSFFRRLEFSTDGHLLFVPAGCLEAGEKVVNSSFVFVRGAFARPALSLPSGEKATIVVRANPQLFELRPPKDFNLESVSTETPEWESHKSLFSLPYRVVFAVATDDSVLIYDSQQTMPVALMKNIHYHQISDLSWSPDGLSLVVSSTDGFCTVCAFDDGELGIPYASRSRRKEVSNLEKDVVMTEVLPEKTTTAPPPELPFTRYADSKKEEAEVKKTPEINTKLNIRRVPAKNGNAEPPESSAKTDSEKGGPKINTILNIRKVKKQEVKAVPVCEDKKVSDPESQIADLPNNVKKLEIEDVEMADESSRDRVEANDEVMIVEPTASETTSDTKKETTSESNKEITSESKNDSTPESKNETTSESKKEMTSETTSESEKETTSESKDESISESKDKEGKKRLQLTTISLLNS